MDMNMRDLIRVKFALMMVANSGDEGSLTRSIDRALELLLVPEAVVPCLEALVERGLSLDQIRRTRVPGIETTLEKFQLLAGQKKE